MHPTDPTPSGRAWAPESHAEFLNGTDLFARVPERSLEAFVDALETVPFPGGTSLADHDVDPEGLFLVQHGRVRLSLTGPTGAREYEFGRGRFFGELGMLGGAGTRNDVIAIRDSALLTIPHERLREITTGHPEALWALVDVLLERMGSLMRGAGLTDSPLRNVAVLPLVESEDVRRAIRDLARAMRTVARTAHVHRDEIAARFGPEAADTEWDDQEHVELTAWLDELEDTHRFVLYEGGTLRDPWTLRCLRQAERILVVAPAGSLPSMDDLRRRFVFPDRCCISELRIEVLLVHSEEVEAADGGTPWIEEADVKRLHHVQLGRREHFERVARVITNRAFGVVMGGGGARGIAHVGALKAFEEARMPVDIVGGTSIGAIFAGGHAMGWSADRIQENVERIFGRKRALIDVTFPYISLLSGNKLQGILDHLFGGLLIENLWSEYFCVSVALNSAAIHVHDRGDAARHIRSSIALPGIFPPVHAGDDVLIDGGVMNNLPTDVMRGRTGGGPVIAIDVSGPGAGAGAPFEPAVSGWRELGGRINPFARGRRREGDDRLLSIFDVLLGSTVVAARSRRNQRVHQSESSLYLRPPVEDFGLMAFERYDELFEIGYRHASEQLERWEPPRYD